MHEIYSSPNVPLHKEGTNPIATTVKREAQKISRLEDINHLYFDLEQQQSEKIRLLGSSDL